LLDAASAFVQAIGQAACRHDSHRDTASQSRSHRHDPLHDAIEDCCHDKQLQGHHEHVLIGVDDDLRYFVVVDRDAKRQHDRRQRNNQNVVQHETHPGIEELRRDREHQAHDEHRPDGKEDFQVDGGHQDCDAAEHHDQGKADGKNRHDEIPHEDRPHLPPTRCLRLFSALHDQLKPLAQAAVQRGVDRATSRAGEGGR